MLPQHFHTELKRRISCRSGCLLCKVSYRRYSGLFDSWCSCQIGEPTGFLSRSSCEVLQLLEPDCFPQKRRRRLVLKLADRQSSQAAPAITPSIYGLSNSISEFSYDPENGVTFECWYRRYEDLFRVDLASQDDAWKVGLLTRKLGPSELEKYTDVILPKSSLDFTFGETVQNLKSRSGRHPHLHTKERSIAKPASPTISSLSLRVTSEDISQQQRMYTTVLINGYPVRLQLDTASDVTIISETQWRSIGSPPLRKQSNIDLSEHVPSLLHLRCLATWQELVNDVRRRPPLPHTTQHFQPFS
uniref:Peptidase A2 domain-containing protein n=1 Tax=Mesocestoides corti TaxID=53468 RepID=A0A5K3FTV0_MESCO